MALGDIVVAEIVKDSESNLDPILARLETGPEEGLETYMRYQGPNPPVKGTRVLVRRDINRYLSLKRTHWSFFVREMGEDFEFDWAKSHQVAFYAIWKEIYRPFRDLTGHNLLQVFSIGFGPRKVAIGPHPEKPELTSYNLFGSHGLEIIKDFETQEELGLEQGIHKTFCSIQNRDRKQRVNFASVRLILLHEDVSLSQFYPLMLEENGRVQYRFRKMGIEHLVQCQPQL